MTVFPPAQPSPRAFTGDEVRRLRESVGVSPTHFAILLGVHFATACRWELAGARSLELDPLHAALLARLAKLESTLARPTRRIAWGRELAVAIDAGGTIDALALLFSEPHPARPRRRTRRGTPTAS
jgi:hypothetical protein